MALVGPVNVGKSTVLNSGLAGRAAAIVSHEAGTTRDVIQIQLDLYGVRQLFWIQQELEKLTGAIERRVLNGLSGLPPMLI